jgi:hypothetical protein
MVVVMVFTINISGGPYATLWGFPDFYDMFLGSGFLPHDPFHLHGRST